MTFEFGGSLYRNSREYHAAIAETFLWPARDTWPQMFAEQTDAELAAECVDGWNLEGVNDDGDKIAPDFDRAELIDAIAKIRAAQEYPAPAPVFGSADYGAETIGQAKTAAEALAVYARYFNPGDPARPRGARKIVLDPGSVDGWAPVFATE